MIIRNQTDPGLGLASTTTTLRQQVLHKQTGIRKKTSAPSASKIAAYAGAFLLLIAVVAIGYESPQQITSQTSNINGSSNSYSAATDDVAPSVDAVIATDVAADLASRANLPIANNVANMSTSLAAKSELAQSDTSAITKPQIIQPGSTRIDIVTYTAVDGDTASSVASKFGLSADTIRWSNDLGSSDALPIGRSLSILPSDGLLHTVAAGETLDSIASKYSSRADRITTVNNLELTSISTGQRLIIPGGVKPAPVVAAPIARVQPNSSSGSGSGSRLNTNVLATAGNRYALGNCTWYSYERRAQLGRPVGSFWGNAKTWGSSARAAGFKVDNVPAPGAVFVDQAGYYGHNGVVERVLPNGDIYITEMNNSAYGGFNIVNDRVISAGQAALYQYIH